MSTDLELARADARRAYAEMEGIHSILLEQGCAPSPNGLRALIQRLSGQAEQMRATMTTPEGYVGQVKEAVAEEVERLRAEIVDLRQRLADAESSAELAAARALGEGDRLRAELARAVADSDRLRDQLSQRPEGGYRLEWSGDWLVLVVGPYRFAVADIERYDDTGHAQLALYGWSPRSSGYYLPAFPGEDVPDGCMDQYGCQTIDCASPLEAMRVCRAMLGIRRVVVPLHPDEMAAGAGGAA